MTDHREGFSAIPRHLFGTLTIYELGVLAAIHSRYPNAYPSLDLLAHDAGTSRTTVQRTLKSLEEKGLVQIDSGQNGGHTNTYILTAAFMGVGQRDLGVGRRDLGGRSEGPTGQVRETYEVEQGSRTTEVEQVSTVRGAPRRQIRRTKEVGDPRLEGRSIFDEEKPRGRSNGLPKPNSHAFCVRRFENICALWGLQFNKGMLSRWIKELHSGHGMGYDEIADFMEFWSIHEDQSIQSMKTRPVGIIQPSQLFASSIQSNVLTKWRQLKEVEERALSQPFIPTANQVLGYDPLPDGTYMERTR